ncbi:MAG: DUF3090 family protein [Candidatus Dormibacteraeota bacterium]|nr:DUF3090 family protein [Candidatus Dormibacteraeota bacterium]
MGEDIEIDPAESVAVGTVGPAGQRAFYIQARSMYRTLTMLVEKVQVQALAERAVEILQGQELGAEEEPAELQEPVQPDWRAGQLGLGVDEDRKMIVLVAQEAPENEDADEDSVATARVWMRPEQALALSARGLELVAKGRPLCPICGLPMDPEGHLCPRKNGKSPIF